MLNFRKPLSFTHLRLDAFLHLDSRCIFGETEDGGLYLAPSNLGVTLARRVMAVVILVAMSISSKYQHRTKKITLVVHNSQSQGEADRFLVVDSEAVVNMTQVRSGGHWWTADQLTVYDFHASVLGSLTKGRD